MNLKPIIAEMRAYWLDGQTGGQLLIGGYEAHYNQFEIPPIVIDAVIIVMQRKCPTPIYLYEIEAEEKMNLNIKEPYLFNGISNYI